MLYACMSYLEIGLTTIIPEEVQTIFDLCIPLTPLGKSTAIKDYEVKFSISELDVCVQLEDMCDYEYFIEQTPFRESCKELVLDVLPHCLELIKHLSTLWT